MFRIWAQERTRVSRAVLTLSIASEAFSLAIRCWWEEDMKIMPWVNPEARASKPKLRMMIAIIVSMRVNPD